MSMGTILGIIFIIVMLAAVYLGYLYPEREP
jgi:hypothetical protein